MLHGMILEKKRTYEKKDLLGVWERAQTDYCIFEALLSVWMEGSDYLIIVFLRKSKIAKHSNNWLSGYRKIKHLTHIPFDFVTLL